MLSLWSRATVCTDSGALQVLLGTHRNIEGSAIVEMIVQLMLKFRAVRTLALTAVVVVAGMGAICAQSAPAPSQKQPAQPQQPAKPAESNPFPEDTKDVPVLPSGNAPATPESNAAPAYAPVMPSGADDPVRSPDDPQDNSEPAGSFSSSASELDKFVPPPDADTRGRRGAKNQPAPEHKETAQEDENVGGYYLNQKNWRAAMSRFESAVVLDPENPDVYWGLAEAQRHLGQFGAAKANYQKVMDYDPDSKHAKEAKKLLSDPEMANASAPKPE
jgi:tetratricopeptide (TPR) repeat protein